MKNKKRLIFSSRKIKECDPKERMKERKRKNKKKKKTVKIKVTKINSNGSIFSYLKLRNCLKFWKSYRSKFIKP